jgi:hypothetical protein
MQVPPGAMGAITRPICILAGDRLAGPDSALEAYLTPHPVHWLHRVVPRDRQTASFRFYPGSLHFVFYL